MEVITGFRLNSNLYWDKKTNFLYKLVKMVNHVSYFTCYKSSCRATAVFKDVCKIKKLHNHKPDLKDINCLMLMSTCKRRAMAENTPPKVIFEEELAKYVLMNDFINNLLNNFIEKIYQFVLRVIITARKAI